MEKQIFIYALLLCSLKIYGQDVLFKQDVRLQSVLKDRRESLPIVHDEKNEVTLFLLDNKLINGFVFTKEYELMAHNATARPKSKFKVLLGHSTDANGQHLFFTNDKKNQFLVKSIHVSTGIAHEKPISLNLKDEKFLETISYKNTFYVMTIIKNSSILKLYAFDGNEISITRTFDFSSYEFSNTGSPKLFQVLNESSLPFQSNLKIHKIDNSNPNPLYVTTKKNKIYYYGDKIYLTLDNNLEDTKIITLDLLNGNSSVQVYDQTTIECGEASKMKSNSYLSRNTLFQIKGCKKEMSFQIKDFKKDSLLKNFRVKENEEITFKNSPLIQEGGMMVFAKGSERELEKTKQVLRKISSSDIGITGSYYQNHLELKLGGYKKVQGGGGGMMMTSPGSSFSGPAGTVSIAPTYHYNPTMYGYGSYASTREVYFKTLLDNKDFNHRQGEASKNAFDRMKDFENENSKDMTSQTVFKVDDYYVLGYYKKSEKKYYLRKFTVENPL